MSNINEAMMMTGATSAEGRPAVAGDQATAGQQSPPAQMPARPGMTTDDTPGQPDGFPVAGPYDMTAPGVATDAGSDNTIEPTMASAVADAMARREELAADVLGQGSTIGDLMALPEVPLAHAKSTGPPDGFSSQT